MKNMTSWWLNHPSEKYVRQIGSFPQIGMNIENIWNHQPDEYLVLTQTTTLPETNMASKNRWLEYDPFLLGGRPIFRGLLLLVSGRVTSCSSRKKNWGTHPSFWYWCAHPISSRRMTCYLRSKYHTHLANGWTLKKKFERLIFPTKYGIPKSSKGYPLAK